MRDTEDALSSLIVCRCEQVGAGEIEHAIAALGCRSVNEVKKLTRAGMGPCQGKVCHRLVALALARLAPHIPEPPGTVNAEVVWGLSRGARGTLVLEPGEPGTEPPA